MGVATGWVLLVLGLWALTGCEVTQEKISLWKGTKNGPQKLAGTVVDSEVSLDLRAKAAVALVEINAWERFRGAFKKMDSAEAALVANTVVPILAEKLDGNGTVSSRRGISAISKLQVDAKDGLYLLLDHAGAAGQKDAQAALIAWCVKDDNTRAMAGQYNAKTIVKKIGPAAAAALVPMLTVDRVAMKHAADLIREVNDKVVLAKASAHLAGELGTHIDQIDHTVLSAAAAIGGVPVTDVLVDLATDRDLGAKLQRPALRALSTGVKNRTVELNDSHIARLFSLAESRKIDRHQREEAYYVIAQAGRMSDLPRMRRLLARKDPFWRAVGLECILRVDGQGQLKGVLHSIARFKRTMKPDDVEDVIRRVSSVPGLLPQARELLGSRSSFVRGVVLGVLGRIGTEDDARNLTKLFNDKTKLPKGFKYTTLGNAARAAARAIEMRG
jgi:hypothetical protein